MASGVAEDIVVHNKDVSSAVVTVDEGVEVDEYGGRPKSSGSSLRALRRRLPFYSLHKHSIFLSRYV